MSDTIKTHPETGAYRDGWDRTFSRTPPPDTTADDLLREAWERTKGEAVPTDTRAEYAGDE